MFADWQRPRPYEAGHAVRRPRRSLWYLESVEASVACWPLQAPACTCPRRDQRQWWYPKTALTAPSFIGPELGLHVYGGNIGSHHFEHSSPSRSPAATRVAQTLRCRKPMQPVSTRPQQARSPPQRQRQPQEADHARGTCSRPTFGSSYPAARRRAHRRHRRAESPGCFAGALRHYFK